MKTFEVMVTTQCEYRIHIQAPDWDEAQDEVDQMSIHDIIDQCEEPYSEEFMGAEVLGEL